MYFALAGMMEIFHYLHYGLSVVLIFVGIKMLVSHYYQIPTVVALGVVAGVLVLSVLVAVMHPKRAECCNLGRKGDFTYANQIESPFPAPWVSNLLVPCAGE